MNLTRVRGGDGRGPRTLCAVFGRLGDGAMKRYGLVLTFLLLPTVGGSEVRVSVIEKRTSATTAYSVEPEAGKVKKIPQAKGTLLQGITTYAVKQRRLCSTECLADAEEILFQGRHRDLDIVVVRKEYNSFSNPLRWVAAFSGHPVQVSSIRVIVVSQSNGASQFELTSKPASYRWEAQVVE